MVDKQLKSNIKKTKDFTTLWVKFHDHYKSATKKNAITQEEESLFLETKSLITDKYKALKDSLRLNSSGDDEVRDVISHVLSLKSMAAMSDKASERLENSWRHSHVFLNKILKDLEGQNRQLAKEKHSFEFLKKIFSKKINQILALISIIVIIFIMTYILTIAIKPFM